jgi:hypothetical protein
MVDPTNEPGTWSQQRFLDRWTLHRIAVVLCACIDRARTHMRRAEAAHDRLCAARVVTDDTIRDLGLSREYILGGPTWQADLPFFMQRNFR